MKKNVFCIADRFTIFLDYCTQFICFINLSDDLCITLKRNGYLNLMFMYLH